MKYPKVLGTVAIIFIHSFASIAQTQYESTATVIYESSTSGTQRSLRSGTFSNRTTNKANNYTEPKTWTYWPSVSGWNSRFYGGKTTTTGSITSGSNVLTTPSGFFSSSDFNKTVEVIGAGPSGAKLVATVTQYVSTTQVQISVSASTTVSGVITHVGDATKPAYTEGHYTTYSNGNFEMNYRLAFPVNYNQGENYKYPMIVMIHGAGERGNCWNSSCFYNSSVITRSNAGSIALGSNILNSSIGGFVATDVKKVIQIDGAGPSGGTLTTTITSFVSGTQVLVANNASTSTTSSPKTFRYGYGSDSLYRNNDLNLTHGGQVHLESIYNPTTGSNGKKAEDPTLPTRAFPGFIAFLQNQDGWIGPGQYEQAYRIVELLMGAYNIDPDRIYIHGLSNGAAAAWEIVRARPDLFTAILPMSATISHGAEIFNSEINKAVPIPAWIFQGGVDTNPTPNNTDQEVSKLKAVGALPRYTVYPTVGHGTWGYAYAEPDFFTWMLTKTKRDIQILFGDSTLCATDNSGVTLALGTGFLAYQWELDGTIIPAASSSTYNAKTAGKYRARFSRISAAPLEAQWNAWSKPVTIRETPAVTPAITAVGTSHLPDINGGNIVRINGPTTKGLTKNWYVNGTLNTTNTNFPANSNLDTANYTLRTTAGRVSLKTIPLNACSSLGSNSIYVTTSTPTNLVAPANPTAQTIAPGTIQLFWTDNTPDETGFEVYRSPNGNANSYNFYKLLPEGAISYTDTGLIPGATYSYQLRAVNNMSVSPYTGNITAVAGSDTQAPTAPQNLTSTNRALTTATLTWTASTDNVGVSGYTIYYGSTTIPTNSTSTTFTLTGLTGNSNYLITVKAVDLAGNISPASNQFTVSTTFSGLTYTYSAVNVNLLTDAGNNWTTPERTGTCSNFDISLRLQDDYFNFNFNGYIYITNGGSYQFRTISDDGSMLFLQGPFLNPSPDFTTYRIVDNDGLHGNTMVTSSSITLLPNTAQQITVLFFEQTGGQSLTVEYMGPDTGNGWQVIPNSVLNSGNAPALNPPLPPTGVTATAAGMSSINLTWAVASGANSYEVYRSTGNSTSYSIVGTIAATPFLDAGLTPNTLYNYKLKSVSNTNGSSVSFSSISSATTAPDSQAPTIPQNVSIISSSYTNASFQWGASTDNVSLAGYKIYANGNLLGTSTTTTFYTTALLPGTNYNITVRAYDISGNESAQSIAANFTTNNPLNFYSKPSSDLSLTTSWTQNTDGSGTNPTSFAYDGQYFTIQNPQTLSNSLTVGGSVSRIIVNDGVTLDISQPLTGTIRVGNGSIVNVNVDFQPTFETVAANSTVNFNALTTTVPVATYGNVTLSGTGLKNIGSGTIQVKGNLTIGNNVGIKGAPSNATTILISGDVSTGATVAQPASDNRVTLQFLDNLSHNVSISSDQYFYKIAANTNAIVTFTTSSAKSLNLGSTNGGGIDLANGSRLLLGNNNLILTNKATVNPTNSTGEISINNGNIQFTTSATTASNFYFTTNNNQVQNFTLQTSGVTNIQKAMEIYDGLKINSGTFAANGNVTLKSSATASAAIQQIVSGSITGNINAERYMSPKRVYRYIASPVAGVTVANWQTYFPITGSFTGASTGSGLGTSPSLYYYSEPSYVAYPTTDNSATIQVGRGYSAYVREGTLPTTITNTGVPTQGNFNFTLTGGTGLSTNGFNLLGNPYACDIVWSNTGWTSNGVGNVIWVRENLVGGGYQWRTWDRSSGTGNLTNGQIPAGQAFWVQTSIASPSLAITEAAKSTLSASSNFNFFRSANQAPTNLFSISIDNGTYQDYTYIKLTDDGSDTYDKLIDGAKNKNSFFNISTVSSDKIDLAVNDLNNSFCDKTIPINLATITPGTYTLQFDNLANFSLATVQLIDSLTLTTTNLNSSNPRYTITVSADLVSYKNRLYIKLTRPNVVTSNVVATAKDLFCRSEEVALLDILNSQSGVAYEAINAADASLSTKIIGTGETIQLAVPIKNLASNQNTIRVRSSFPGCSSSMLTTSKVVTVSELPTLTAPTEVPACLGGTVNVTVTGTGKTYQWFNENTAQTLSETGSSLQIAPTDPIQSYRVTAISDKGCKSEYKNFLVRADSLEIPTISLVEGDLKTDATKSVQWLLNDQPINGATSSIYQPTTSGSYSVQSKNTYCVRTSTKYLVTAIEDWNHEPFILTVYPNPSDTGSITVSGSTNSNEPMQLHIVDLLGKQLAEQPLSSSDYSKGVVVQHHLSAGVYLVQVIQNGKTAHQKVVIR